jgi:ribosome-binding factor A
MAQLHEKRGMLQHLLSKRVVLKYTPHLHFKLDDAIARGTRVISLLEEMDIPPDDTPSAPKPDEN